MLDPLNFDFLKDTDSRLAELGSEAENLLYQRRYGACIITIRKFAERLTRIVARENGIANYEGRKTFYQLLNELTGRGDIESEQSGWLDTIRKAGNQVQAGHESASTDLPIPADSARECLEYALKLGEWFNRSYGKNPSFEVEPFKSPLDLNYKFEELSFLNYEFGGQKLPSHNFWIIEGIAGSGKTYIAIQEAKRLSEQGNKVLILVFNEAIADYLRDQLADSATVYNYHAYCEHIFHDVVKYEWQLPEERATRKDYCANVTPKLLLKALEEVKKDKQKHFDYFNAIIVDEGQDFCPWWWEGIVKLAENEIPNFFYFIYDASQNYQDVDVQESIKELKKIMREKTAQEFNHLSLTKNFRNSRKIASKLYKMFDIRVIESATKHLPEGDEEPEEKCFSHPLLEREWIKEKIIYLVREKHARSHQIAIISLQHFNKSIFCEDNKLGNYQIINIRETPCTSSSHIQFIEAQRVKGLEYDYVFVIGFFEPANLSSRYKLLLYLSASRAKQGLYMAYRSRGYALT